MLVPTVTNGHISAVKMDYKGSPVLQSDAAITHGNSGGPAFDPDGKVIGIATFGAQEAAGFNFFVPINTAMEFVRQAGAPPESGSFDSTWHAALDAMAAHQWSKAHVLIGDVLEIMPGEPTRRACRSSPHGKNKRKFLYGHGLPGPQLCSSC